MRFVTTSFDLQIGQTRRLYICIGDIIIINEYIFSYPRW
jgi:hypothetical protein